MLFFGEYDLLAEVASINLTFEYNVVHSVMGLHIN